MSEVFMAGPDECVEAWESNLYLPVVWVAPPGSLAALLLG